MLWGSGESTVTIAANHLTMEIPMPQPNITTRSDTPTRCRKHHHSRAQRWQNAVTELTELQKEYGVWLQALPDSLQETATAEALQGICDIDLSDLQAIEPPRGFGRD
jgi:hypothetical protein